MLLRRSAAIGLAIAGLGTMLSLRDGRVGLAHAEPPAAASSAPKMRIVRIPASAKTKRKSVPPSATDMGPTMAPCVAARYVALEKMRASLMVKHGGATTSFFEEYGVEKQKLVSNEALEAAGCKP